MASVPVFLILRKMFPAAFSGRFDVDLEELKENYSIHHKPHAVEVGIVFMAVLITFMLHPLHHMQPAWTSIIGGVATLVITNHEDIQESVKNIEWDTLIFFGALFVFAKALDELHLMAAIGDSVTDAIISAETETMRMIIAIELILWTSCVMSGVAGAVPTSTGKFMPCCYVWADS